MQLGVGLGVSLRIAVKMPSVLWVFLSLYSCRLQAKFLVVWKVKPQTSEHPFHRSDGL